MEVEKNSTLKRKWNMDILLTSNKKPKTKKIACLNCTQKSQKNTFKDCKRCYKQYCKECLFECEHCDKEKCLYCFLENTTITCVFWKDHCCNCEKLICADCKIYCRSCEKYYCNTCITDNGGCPWSFNNDEHIVLSKNCERSIKDLSMIK